MRITVIGGGPGGYEAAIYAAKRGAEVTLVEKDRVGGTCLNRGCIPTKALLASAGLLASLRKAEAYGLRLKGADGLRLEGADGLRLEGADGLRLEGALSADAAAIIERKDKIVAGLVSGVEYTLNANGVRRLQGSGRLAGPARVEVTGAGGGAETVESDAVLLATGSAPAWPGFLRPDGERILTSDELLALRQAPASIIVLGGGVIGCELGQYLARLGSAVTIVELMPHLLPFEDEDVAAVLQRQFRRDKIKTLCGTGLSQVAVEAGGVVATLADGSALRAEKLLVATGRRPYTEELDLQAAGLAADARGFIPVNRHMQTAVGGIYAIGDVVATPQLAHVASKEGMVAVDNMLGTPAEMSYQAVPRCVYTEPEVGAVGLTEGELQAQGLAYRAGRFDFAANGKAKAAGTTDGFVKVLANEADVLVGAAIAGAHATEMLQALTLAVAAGMTARQAGAAIYPHPTMGEAVMEALHDVHGMSIHKIT